MDSKLYVMALVSILTVVAFGLVVAEDNDSEAAPSYGSASSPLSSLNITVDYDNDFKNVTFYVVKGGSVHVEGQDGTGYENSVKSVTSGYGLSISNYVLSGSLTKVGSVAVTMHYEDDNNTSTDYTFTITSVDSGSGSGSISYTSPSAVDALTGSTITYKPTVNVSGASFSTTTVSGKSNASWLSLSSGTLSGKAPSVSSKTSYYYSIKAVSPGGQEAVQTVSFTVYPIAQISSSVKTAYSITQNSAMTDIALSGNVDMTWGKSGDLPAGLVLSGSKISGTPTEFGTFSIVLKGYTVDGPYQTATKKITFTVAEQTMTITSEPPSGIFYAGKNYTYSPTVNLSAGCTWSLKDNPSWLVLSNGVITGTVPNDATQGTVTYTLTATSAGNQVKSQICTFDIEPVQEFTSVPTAACVVIPVVNYTDDGEFNFASVILDFIGSIGAFFDIQSVEADDISYGSQDSPLSSLNISPDNNSSYKDKTFYVSIGGSVSIDGAEGDGYFNQCTDVTSGFGLSLSNGAVSGTLTKQGSVVVSMDYEDENSTSRSYTFTIVSVGDSWVSDDSGSSGGNGAGDSGSDSDSGTSGSSGTSDSGSVPVAEDPSIINSTDTRTFRFVWTGEDATSVTWDFGDGSTATGFDVRHTYSDNGTYKYTCTGHNKNGDASCSGTIVVDVPLVKHLWNSYMIYIIIALVILFILIVAIILRHNRNAAYVAYPSDGTPRRSSGPRYYNRSGRKQGSNRSGRRNGGRR